MRFRGILQALSLLALLGQTAMAQSASDSTFADPTHWRTFDWASAADSEISRSPEWGATITSDQPRFAEKRTQPIVLQGRVLELRAVVDKSGNAPTHRFQIASDGNEALCASVFDWATSHFGRAVSKVTTTEAVMGDGVSRTRFVMEAHEWRIGATSIMLDCIGVGVEGPARESLDSEDDIHVVLDYRAAEKLPRVLPLTSISCVGTNERARDMVLVLDETDQGVLRSDLSPVASAPDVTFTPTMVHFTRRTTSAGAISYELNRLSGRLVARAEIETGEASIQWMCEKVDLDDRKF